MNSLNMIFRPLAKLINRRIDEQTPARELATSLEGEVMAIRVANTALAVYLHVQDAQLVLGSDYDDEPSVIVSGSLLSLATLAGSDPQAAVRDGRVQMSGDAMLAEKFQKLLRFAKPDVEDELSNVVGDVAAHQASKVAATIAGVGASAFATLQSKVGEFLTKKDGGLPAQEDYERLRSGVEKLRDDVARAEARVQRLKAQRDGEPS